MTPVPSDEPPETTLYQFKLPALPVACNSTVPVPQRAPGIVPVMVGVVLMVAITAVLDDVQLLFVAST